MKVRQQPTGWAPALALLACAAAGCTAPPPLGAPPPEARYTDAVVPGLPAVRGWGDELTSNQTARAQASLEVLLRRRWEEEGRPRDGLTSEILALSGGGPDGAFAAGLLYGWTEAGDRPEFELVTGVSVGALIAPFAFLGPARDETMRALLTGTRTEDVLELRLFSALFGALSLADAGPLRAQLSAVIDDAMLAEIAVEHRRGRRLLVLTTNIDAARPVIWDMGAIADAGARDLFIDVTLASASIPGVFAPVPIAVEIDGRPHVELHVDGGVTRSVAIGPTGVEAALASNTPFPVRRTVYVIQNNALQPRFRAVERSISGIAARSVSTLIRAQSKGDLVRIYHAAKAAEADFRLIFVPPDFSHASAADFDPDYMAALFEAARRQTQSGILWSTELPGGSAAPNTATAR